MDSQYSSTETLFKTDKEGFKLSYKGLQERHDPIFASELMVPLIIENITQEALLYDIMQGQEERFGVMIKKSGVFFWAGVLLQDLVQIEDIAFPYGIELKFSDGLGRLKDIDYSNGRAPYSGRATFITHLINILTKTGVSIYWASAYQGFLKTCINWYDANHNYSRNDWCPLAFSDLDHFAFQKLDEEGNYSFKNCYDVLSQICRTWNARIFLSDGVFYFVQVDELAKPYLRTRTFLKTGVLYTHSTVNDYKITSSDYKRLSGGLHKYYPPLRYVKKIYEYFQSINNSSWPNLLPPQDDYETTVNFLNSISGGGGEQLEFSGIFHHWLTGTAVTQFSVRFAVKIRIEKIDYAGTYLYLWYPGSGDMIWSTDSSKYYQYDTPIPGQGSNWNVRTPFGFITPPIPWPATATFQFVFIGFYFGATPVTLPPGSSWDYDCEDFRIQVYTHFDQPEDGTLSFQATNTKTDGTTPVDSTSKLELPNTLIGDGPCTFSIGRIKTSNGIAWVNSTNWKVHQITPALPINYVSVISILAGQKVPTSRFAGSFASHHITARNIIICFGKNLLPLSFNLDPSTDHVSGEWFDCSLQAPSGSKIGMWIDSGIWIDDDTWQDTSLQGSDELISSDRYLKKERSINEFLNSSVSSLAAKNINLINLNIITTTDEDIAAGATTSIPIAPYTDTTLVHDDIIQLVDPVTFEIHTLTVAVNPGSINSIAIDSYTFTKDIPAGAYIVFGNKEILKIVR